MQDKLFNVQYVDLDLKKNNKFETIEHLAKLASDRLVDVEKYIEDVKKRESISTTGIGDGVAIPHAKSAFVKVPTVIVGKSNSGIDWESLDEQPANIVFLIAVPDGEGDAHLKILQTLAISLMDDDFKEELLSLDDKEKIVKLLLEKTNS